MLLVCKNCKVEKPLEDYYAHLKGKYGVTQPCKDCKRGIPTQGTADVRATMYDNYCKRQKGEQPPFCIEDENKKKGYVFNTKLEACKKMEEIVSELIKLKVEITKHENGYVVNGKHIYYNPHFAITPLL